MSEKRFYRILCWAHGSNPENYFDLFEGLDVPNEEVAFCLEEYENLANNWNRILEPYTKESIKG